MHNQARAILPSLSYVVGYGVSVAMVMYMFITEYFIVLFKFFYANTIGFKTFLVSRMYSLSRVYCSMS